MRWLKRVGHVDVASGVDRDSVGSIELPIAAADRAPLGDIHTRIRELLDAVVELVHDVDVAGRVRRHFSGTVNWPSPVPCVPHWVIPVLLSFWIRSLK
jgi:hypothetical protein